MYITTFGWTKTLKPIQRTHSIPAMAKPSDAGIESLRRLKETDPPSLLAPNPSLSETARAASQYLFSTLRPFSRKSPLDNLLVDGFDAEQIWQQIDLQSQPLLSSLRRRVKQLSKSPEEIINQLKAASVGGEKAKTEETKLNVLDEEESDSFDEELDEEDEEGVEKENGKEEEEEEDESEESEGEEEKGEGGGVEDKFLKIDELTKYLEKEEENFENAEKDEKSEDDDDDEEEDDESDEAGGFDFDDDDDEEEEDTEGARYDDFFGGKKEKGSKRKARLPQDSEDYEDEDDMELDEQTGIASTHEKELETIQSKIEQMEKSNLDPKTWTMQGEVTAAKRPKNSALEVDLDFEHNVRPAPVITEEVTASIEDMIQKRITEGHFNDVQRAPKLPSKAPREVKELDDNKSKQGLAEIYEQEYVQKKDPTSAPLSFNDELHKEASMLFKKISLKLDALTHFNFAPKPVIEDMSIQTNVPALTMEEIAPVAVSDAAMLAPEEIFDGRGDIKEETELTKTERKRRRANKKRKFEAETVRRQEKKGQKDAPLPIQVDG
ncbi:PREDICTED: U3 small nucleolar ribonucleoprotein protein MPP10 isoform X2 [Lupinus angustifolius]|uniref:U3 small nucleolar ribonucleoprotein protein MPP10 isoform X2 n=1 Tax=Lupinus angustifolius TaxID=3871 RepID=UPI00092E5E80|nr:PREDICTED: U3 small nucleolar ribonucleoprotein protein MPP10 isoform X2 [Lupinus angustifolius]